MHELHIYPGEVLVVWARSRSHGHSSGKSWPPVRVGLSSALSVRTIHPQILQSIVLTICIARCLYWLKCCHRVNCQWVAVGHQDGILFGWVVVEPAILLLGDWRRRSRRVWFVAYMEPYYSSAVVDLCYIRCEWVFWHSALTYPLGLCCILIAHLLFQMVFSFISSHLVRSFAKYAAGSGISEIKCILAGFVMQGYLGFATFFIKSITLVSSQTVYNLHTG